MNSPQDIYISELRKYEYVKEMKSWQTHTLVHQNKINQNFYTKKIKKNQCITLLFKRTIET